MRDLIVCATDFSPEANAALRWAAALARRDGGRVDLLHVVRAQGDDARKLRLEEGGSETQPLAARELEQQRRLEEAAEGFSREEGIVLRPLLLHGHPYSRILEHAQQENARLVVLGTGGQSFVDRWVLGSVAERVVRAADRPVVLVPKATDQRPWRADSPRPPRVLAGLASGDDVGVLRFAADLRRAPCDVRVVHLYWPLLEYSRLGLQGRRDPIAPDPEIVANLEPGLRRRIGAYHRVGEYQLDIRPAWGDATANLLVAAEEHSADLVVIGVEHREGVAHRLNRSIGERLAHESRYVPIACVPVEREQDDAARALPALRSVLAVTDFSDKGNRALPHAYALLAGRGGVVELCHVYEHALPNPAYAYDLPSKRMSEETLASLSERLRGLVPATAGSSQITTHVSVIDGGKAAEAIVQASERLDVDAIVLGSHGHTGLGGALLGSVASEVLHRARRPVFVVREAR